MSGTVDDDEDLDEGISGAWTTVQSGFSWDGSALRGGAGGTAKTGAGVANTVGGMAVTAAQLGTHTSSLAVAGAIAAGAAVSATGLGLVIVGGVLTLGSMITSGTSMVKTTAHVLGLKRIRDNPGRFSACSCMSGARLSGRGADRS